MAAPLHPLRVPRGHLPALEALRDLAPDRSAALIDALSGVPEAVSASAISRTVSEAGVDLPADVVDSLVDAALALNALATAHRWPAEATANQVARSPDIEFESEDVRTLFAERLSAAMVAPSVVCVAKIDDVYTADERVFHTTRVVTEIRPVWVRDVADDPTLAVIRHTFQIDYVSDHGFDSFYVAVSDSDVQEMMLALERAQEKSASLKRVAESAGMRLVDVESEDA